MGAQNNDAPRPRSPETSHPGHTELRSIDAAVKANSKLLRQLAEGTVGLIRNNDVPFPIKFSLVPLLVEFAAFGAGIVIFVGNCSVNLILGQAIRTDIYLIYFGTMAGVSSATCIWFAQISSRFQNSKELNDQLSTVTQSRRSRRRSSPSPANQPDSAR